MRIYDFFIIALALTRWLCNIFLLLSGQCIRLKYIDCFDEHSAPNVHKDIGSIINNSIICNPCFFLVESLNKKMVKDHCNIYGVNSIIVLRKSLEFLKMCLWFILFAIFFHIFGTFSLIVYIFISLINIDYIRLFYIRMSLQLPRNSLTEFWIPSVFPSLTPCDGHIYLLSEGSRVMLERPMVDESIVIVEKTKYDFKDFSSLLNEIVPKKHLALENLYFKGVSKSLLLGEVVRLNISTFDTVNYNHIDFKISCGRFYCETGITQPDYNCTVQNLNIFLNKIVHAKSDMELYDFFSIVGNGFIHKRKGNLDCTEYCNVLLKKPLIVKGILNVDCALDSLLNKDFRYVRQFDFKNLRLQLEYANLFFSKSDFKVDFQNVNCLLNSMKSLLINKTGRNYWGMPNAAWKRFTSDCCWISNYRYKGLDVKPPTETLLEFAHSKNISIKNPDLKPYSLKGSKKFLEDTNRKHLDDQTIKENNHHISKIKQDENNFFKNAKKSKLITEEVNKDLYVNENKLLSKTPKNLKINASVKSYLMLDNELPTLESYKDQILKNIKDSEEKLAEYGSILRDKNKPGKEKSYIKTKMLSTSSFLKTQKEKYLPRVLNGDFNFSSSSIKYQSKEIVKSRFYVEEADKFDEKVVLYNMYDVLSVLDEDEDKGLSICDDEIKKVIIDQGGVKKLKGKLNKIVKEKSGHTIDDVLLSKIAFKIEEMDDYFRNVGSKYSKRSGCPLVKRYKKHIHFKGDHSIMLKPVYKDDSLFKVTVDFDEELKVNKKAILKNIFNKKLNLCRTYNKTAEYFIYFNDNYNP